MPKKPKLTLAVPPVDGGSTPPPTLSPAAQSLWTRLTDEYDFSDLLGRVMLEEGLICWDRARAATETIAREGAVLGGAGKARRHPAVGIERDARAQAIRIFRELGLNLEPVKPIGRPPGR